MSVSLGRMQASLHEYSEELMDRPNGQRLHAIYEELAEDYEELLANIREEKISEIKAAHLKPVNYFRNIFHVAMGLTSALLYQFVFSRETALIVVGSILFAAGTMEISRRFSTRWNDFLVDKVFGTVSRPHERAKTNGSTFYVLAIFLLLIFFSKPVALISVLILGFADPAASVIGKLWGRRKLFKDKSFVGTGSFFTVAFAVSFGFAMLALPEYSVAYRLIAAAGISLVATATELLSTRIDDNFSIPMSAALAASLFF